MKNKARAFSMMHPRERLFAKLLTEQGRKWEYPAQRFQLKNTTYRPDFFLPDENLYIEVVGTRQAYHANKHKIAEMKETYPNIRFVVMNVDGKTHSPRLKHIGGKMTHRLIVEYKTEKERERIKLFRLYCWMNGNKTMREVVMEMIKKYNHYNQAEHSKPEQMSEQKAPKP